MKVVLWRLAHDYLPTGYQLQVDPYLQAIIVTFAVGGTIEHYFCIVTMLKKYGNNFVRIMEFACT